jgi:hypothetical protein
MDRLGDTKMALRTIFITAAITAVAVLGTIGSASAGNETWERNKPHVNLGTTAIMVKDALTTSNNSIQGAPIDPEVIVRRKMYLVEIY